VKYSTNEDATLVLISNKVELLNAGVKQEEAEEFTFANSMMFIETSAKTRYWTRCPRCRAAKQVVA